MGILRVIWFPYQNREVSQPIPPVPQIIEFDIAVTASEGSEAKAGIGVFSGVIGLGTQAKMEGSNATLSRIKFSIPVLYPEQVIR